MTLPDERYRSLLETRRFLYELQSPSVTPRVPKVIRQRARSLLKHWPESYHLEMMTIDMPQFFANEVEPLYKMVKKYSEDKE